MMENKKKDEYGLEEIFYSTLSDMLAEERNEYDPSNQKVSQLILADHSEVSKNYVGMVERGEIHPSFFKIVKILVSLDKDPTIFICKFLKKVNVTKKGIELDSQRKKMKNK